MAMAKMLLSSSASIGAAVAIVPAGYQRISNGSTPRFVSPGVRRVGGGNGFACRQSRQSLLATRLPKILCQASEKEKVEGARRDQVQATELFAELLKADDVRAVAQENVASLSEDFFMIASTYLDLFSEERTKNFILNVDANFIYLPSHDVRKAKKEGNVEVVSKLESTLQIALSVKEATLRPEIRVLNQLLREKDAKSLSNTIQSNLEYLQSGSYFFQLLKRMISDVEKQTENPKRLQLLAQLRYISKEANEVNKAAKRSKGFGAT